MFRNSKAGFVVSGAVLILACYTNPSSVWAQEVCNSSVIISDEEPFVCGFVDDFIPGERWVRDQRDDPVLGPFPVLVILVNFEVDPDCDCVEDCIWDDCFQPEEYVTGDPPGGSGEVWEDVTTSEQAYGIFFGDDDIDPDYLSVSDYYDEVSYGRMQLTGDATGYYTLDIDLCIPGEGESCSYNPGLRWEVKTQAIAAANDDGWDVDLSGSQLVSDTYEGVIFALPIYPGHGSSFNAGEFTYQYTLNRGTSIHEQGHMIGLLHANSMDCGEQEWGPDGTCSFDEYGNHFDQMGANRYGHFNAAFKWKHGWLDDVTQVLTLTDETDDGTYFFTPLEVAGDVVFDNYVSALSIPRGDGSNYVWEFRQPLGFDELVFNRLLEYSPDYFRVDGFDGLMANRAAPNIFSYLITYLLDMTPDSQFNPLGGDPDFDFYDAVLLIGQNYTDLFAGFSITPVEIVDGGTEEAILEVEVRFSTIEVDAGLDRSITYGEQVTLGPVEISGGEPPYTCEWVALDAPDEPISTSCIAVTVTPLETTYYLIVVHDSEPDSVPRGAWVEVEVIINDCNDNSIPDVCDLDCGSSGGPCDLDGCGGSLDCQSNGIPDECDIADGTSDDYNDNGIPDICEPHRTIYVDDVTDPDEDGSWEHPFDTLAEAIDDSISWDTIVVLDGYYTGEGNRDLDFDGRVLTVRSENGPASCTIDCGGSGRAFIFDNEEGPYAIVDGFTIVNGSADQGGAIYLGEDVEVTVRHCVITGNSADSGGGIYAYRSYPTISNCKITGNTATEDGGGLAYVGSAVVLPDTSIRNCTIAGNLATNGGGLAIGGFGTTIWLIHNCTITGNRATSSGGGIYFTNNNPTLQNCILWGDEAPIGHEIAISPALGFGTISLTVDFSDVEGGVENVEDDPDDRAILVWGEHNIDADPLFVDPGHWDDNGTPGSSWDDFWVDGDSHMSADSPCIDAGDPGFDGEGLVDMDGEPRVVDGDGDGVALVDMGADEYHDCNGNDVPDYLDIAEGTSDDCDGNGIPDECEAVPLDIKPGSCPNPLNRNSHGILPVAVVGSECFDVTSIEISSVRLARVDGEGGQVAPNEGPPGPHSTFEDVAAPFEGQACDCHDLSGDGIDDLSVKFRTDEVVEALELDDLNNGDLVELVISGTLVDGSEFTTAADCILIVPQGNPNIHVESNVPGAFVEVTPGDLNVDGCGFASFGRLYQPGTVVTLTAPTWADAQSFSSWQVNGVTYKRSVTIVRVTVSDNVTVKVMYVPRPAPLDQAPALGLESSPAEERR